MSIVERLESGDVLLCDGGMGAELQRRVGQFDCPERLNLRDPDAVAEAHKAFFDAGSDMVETNTFGGSRAQLERHDLGDRVSEIARKAAEIARRVCPEGRYVLGSIGPTGEMLEPYGSAKPHELKNMFAEQAEALAEGGVDALIVETMMDGKEARLAVTAAKKTTDLPVFATMTFDVSGRGIRTKWGVNISDAVTILTDAGADAIGSNCGDGFDEMIEVIEEMRRQTDMPLIAQANAGVPEMIEDVLVYPEAPEQIVPKVRRMLEVGVSILGGCCGTRPEHLRVMRRLVDGVAAR